MGLYPGGGLKSGLLRYVSQGTGTEITATISVCTDISSASDNESL